MEDLLINFFDRKILVLGYKKFIIYKVVLIIFVIFVYLYLDRI